MKQVLYAILLSAALFTKAVAQDTIFPKGEISTTNNHTGTIWLNELSVGDTVFTNSIALATTHITILEIYADTTAYKAHLQTPHFIKYKTGTKDMVKSLELVATVPLIPEMKIN